MSNSTDQWCPECGSQDIDIEVWANGIVPAEPGGSGFKPADDPALYVEWDYGKAFCNSCGTSI